MLTHLTLRVRLLLTLTLVVSLSIGVATFFSIRYFSGKIYDEAVNNMRMKVQVAESMCYRAVSDMLAFTQILANDPTLKLLISSDYRLGTKISTYLTGKIHQSPLRIVVVGPHGELLATVEKGQSSSPEAFQNPLLQRVLREKQGGAVASFQKMTIGHAVDQILVISAAMAMTDRNDHFAGAILLQRLLSDTSDFVEQIENLLGVVAIIYLDGQPVNGRTQFPPIDPKISETLLRGEKQRYEVKDIRWDGQLAEYIPLNNDFHTPVGILGIFQSANRYVQTRNEAIEKLLGIMIVCLLGASGLGFLLARSILVPISDLLNGVQQISTGDLSHTIAIESRDELGTLASAFNGMAARLHESFQKIHEQVREIQQASEDREQLVLRLQENNTALQLEISERKRAEEERQHLEVQLRQAHKLEALGTLAGGMAHDFNNLLAIMMLHTEILLDSAESSEDKGNLERIYQAGERGAELVRHILTFSRSEEQHRVPVNIAPVVEEALQMIRATIPPTITIRHHIKSDCSPILANTTQIHQVVVNLCVNAGHAMSDSGGVLEVYLQEVTYASPLDLFGELPAGAYVMLVVKDTGCGMTSDVQERIFEPFFTTKAIGTGTGLGLSVVHGIVKTHQGTIRIESAPGKGTTAKLFFPVAGEKQEQENTGSEPCTRKGHESILLVDDEIGLLTAYEHKLTDYGYRVTAFCDGCEAFRRFREHPDVFELVFTDQAMPNMTGIELSREILRIRPDIPIILTSGYSDVILEKAAKAVGIRHFLLKPIQTDSLLCLIRQTLDNGKSR